MVVSSEEALMKTIQECSTKLVDINTLRIALALFVPRMEPAGRRRPGSLHMNAI